MAVWSQITKGILLLPTKKLKCFTLYLKVHNIDLGVQILLNADLDEASLEWGLRCCVSKMFPDDDAGLWTTTFSTKL